MGCNIGRRQEPSKRIFLAERVRALDMTPCHRHAFAERLRTCEAQVQGVVAL
jgi:hypothetical protein